MKTTKDQTNRVRLYAQALSFLGVDASPLDVAIDDLGCADSVSAIIKSIFPQAIKGSVSTAELNNQLKASPFFFKPRDIRPGDIVMSPTGMGKTGKIKNGHVGIVGENDEIMSNSSATGLWTTNFTFASWIKRYREQGGYPIIIYRVK